MAPPSQEAPARDGQNTNKMRQKILMSLFGITPSASASTSSSSQAVPTNVPAVLSKPKQAATASKAPIEHVSDDTSSDPTRSKDASLPNVSDPSDIEMLSAKGHASEAKGIRPTVRSVRAPT